jgi:putative oxidoreductase
MTRAKPERRESRGGLSEAVGGALLAAGLFMPLAAASLIGTMITPIRTVHWKNGVWVAFCGPEPRIGGWRGIVS